MIARFWTSFLLLLAGGFTLAWIIALLRERNFHPVRNLAGFIKQQSKLGRVLFGVFVIAMVIFGGTKPDGGSGGTGDNGDGTNGLQMVGCILSAGNVADEWADFEPIVSTNTTRQLTGDDFRRGFVMTRVGTDEAFDFSPPTDAVACSDWLAFGAAEDWFYLAPENWAFRLGTNAVDRFRVFSFGLVDPMPPATNRWFAPFRASLGVVPQANWNQLPAATTSQTSQATQTSLFWHLVTPSNTLQLTWQNVLLNRAADSPVSFQMELGPHGRFVYRFDLSRLDIDEVTNILVGASLDGPEWTTNALPTNVTSLAFHPLVSEDTENADRDGDGLTLLDELFFHHTDPDLRDTDGDGVSDGDEVCRGTSPLARDTDCDSFSDGTDPRPTDPDPWTDADGDGFPDAWKNAWFGLDASASATADTNGDGVSNLAALLTGVHPTNAPSAGFRSDCGAAASRMVAWEIARTGFSFTRPIGLTNLVSRTFCVDRTSPWQQLFVSSRPNAAAGWSASDVRVRYGLDGGPVTNLVPALSLDSWRLPLDPDAVTNITFVVEAVGDAPALSNPLHLIRWSPRVSIPSDESGSFMSMPAGKAPVFMASRRAESGWYVVPFVADRSDMPHAGPDAGMDEQLALPPVRDVAVTNVPTRALLSPDPVWVELPPEGTNASVRVCCWEIRTTADGDIASGPRSSQYDSPYPLSSPALRLGFHRASHVESSTAVTLRIYPEHPLVGLFPPGWPRTAQQNALRLLAASSDPTNEPPYNPITGNPPYGGTPGIDGVPYDAGYTPVDPVSDEAPGDTTDEDDDDGCGDDECPCGGDAENDGSEQCSFRLRISLGSSVPGEPSGFLWTALEQPTCVTTTVFNVLAASGCSVMTNAVGAFTVVNSNPGGRTVTVTNMPCGVAISVWNASGRFEALWEVTNPGGDTNYVRCRRITVLGSVTSDELFCLNDGMGLGWDLPEDARVSGLDPSDRVVREDAIHGVRNVKRKWRTDPPEPEFATDVFDEVICDGARVSAVMSEFAKFGEGATARRRLVRRYGFDEQGGLDETRDYWNDAGSRRHARLKSIRSNRQAWSFHDYDERGRETVLLEQLDGSPFPDGLAEVSHQTALPAGCSAKATATSYAPATGDSDDRNDVDLPRRRDVYVLRAGRAPTLIGTETWLYTRATDSAGVPLRTCVHASGIGSVLRSETTVDYPEGDYAVPKELRGRAVSSLDFDGILATQTFERGTWDPATRVFTVSPSGEYLRTTTRRSRNGVFAKTYTVSVENALRRLAVYRAELLTADDATIDWAASTYDDVDRLRSTVYTDGTFETNAYSCCRLLWRQDRKGRKVLRSARTGTDDLYYAEEEVWLSDVSTNGQYRVTQHFFDGLGRETNTVVSAGTTPGEAQDPEVLSPSSQLSHSTTAYPDGGDTIHVDERGKTTETDIQRHEDREERTEIVSTNDVELVETTTTTYRNGRMSTERRWRSPEGYWHDAPWTRETRLTDYAADGHRIDTVVTESSDCGIVTNSVTTYDLLGRVVFVSTLLSEVANTYDGLSSRVLSVADAKSGVSTTFLYDEHGEQIGTSVNGVTNTSVTTYEDISNAIWKVVTDAVVGTSTNSRTITRTRFSDLSDACRRHAVTIAGTTGVPPVGGVRTEALVSYDPDTGIETETTTSDLTGQRVVESRHGVDIVLANASGTTTNHYDALGRRIRVVKGEVVQESAYDAVGALVETRTLTATNALCEMYSYDMFGRRIETVNALGQSTYTSYDPVGNVISEWGATCPVQYEYDTQGRRTALGTTLDGSTWNLTRWTYDAATGLCIRKTYADGSCETYSHTDDGLLETTTHPSGRWQTNEYDVRRRLVGTTSSDGALDAVYARDVYGRIVSASNGVAQTDFALHEVGIATNESWIVGTNAAVVTRSVDGLNRLQALAIGGTGYVQHFAYTPDNLFATISNGEAVVTYAYGNDRCETGYTLTLANGTTFTRTVMRDPNRPGLVTSVTNRCGATVQGLSYTHDDLSRPVSRNDDTFSYNLRGEVSFAQISGNTESHVYDLSGNSTFAAYNAVTNLFTANNLNQYSAISTLRGSAPPRETTPDYDSDGNLITCGPWTYTYDSASRLVTVSSNGVLLVTNAYDYRGRRVVKTTPSATHTFLYDDWNLIRERVDRTDGSTDVFQYFWGRDLSGSLQGAGGIGGLLYMKVNGTIYIPFADANGNITSYVDSSGILVAEYVYDAFGQTLVKSGPLADVFRYRFSSKYFDVETGVLYYGKRFYKPALKRWLNRDPIEEKGGINLYAFCRNVPLTTFDCLGLAHFEVRKLSGAPGIIPYACFGMIIGSLPAMLLDFGLADSLNIEILHEHLFYDDGTNVGYGHDGEFSETSSKGYVRRDSTEYDDCIMKEAQKRISKPPYSLLGWGSPKFNCQDYASSLRRMYNDIKDMEEIKCKCRRNGSHMLLYR